MYRKIDWFEENDINESAYGFWNDVDIERQKVYYCNNYGACENAIKYVKSIGVYDDLQYMLKGVDSDVSAGISLGAGICWEANILYNEKGIRKMDFLEFSKHRIFDIAPIMLNYLKIPEETDYRLILGNYYNVKVDDESYDFIILSEALMMAEYPQKLLRECYRLLKKNGRLLIVGEPRLTNARTMIFWYTDIRNRILGKQDTESYRVWRERRAVSTDISGANNYVLFYYKRMIRKQNFKIKYIGKQNRKFWSFYLEKI